MTVTRAGVRALAAVLVTTLLLGGCSLMPGGDDGHGEGDTGGEQAAYEMSVDCPDAPAEQRIEPTVAQAQLRRRAGGPALLAGG